MSTAQKAVAYGFYWLARGALWAVERIWPEDGGPRPTVPR